MKPLRIVAPAAEERATAAEAEAKPPAYIYAHEAEQRARIAAVDWAALHVRSDRRAPIALGDYHGRGWLL